MFGILRNIGRSAVLSALGNFKKARPATYFLNGHYVSMSEMRVERQLEIFHNQLKVLSNHFDLVGPEEAVANQRQTSSRLLCLTFDDGLAENYTVLAPVARDFRIACLFFINPAYLGLSGGEADAVLRTNYFVNLRKDFLTAAQVHQLASDGHIIGSHTFSHTRLSNLGTSELERELDIAKAEIEKITSTRCDFFAYPFGGVHDITAEGLKLALARHPFVFSSTTSNRLLEFNGTVINRRHFEGNWPYSHINFFLSRRI